MCFFIDFCCFFLLFSCFFLFIYIYIYIYIFLLRIFKTKQKKTLWNGNNVQIVKPRTWQAYWKTIFLSLNPIVNGVGGGKFNPPPLLPDFFNNFISLKVRAWNFLTLRFYPLDTMCRNFIKIYWLVDKLWHFCHQWLAKSTPFSQNRRAVKLD